MFAKLRRRGITVLTIAALLGSFVVFLAPSTVVRAECRSGWQAGRVDNQSDHWVYVDITGSGTSWIGIPPHTHSYDYLDSHGYCPDVDNVTASKTWNHNIFWQKPAWDPGDVIGATTTICVNATVAGSPSVRCLS